VKPQSTLAHSLAAQSDHPVSKAVAAGLEATQAQTVEAFMAIAGRGVSGNIDGTQYWFGNHRLIEERGICSPAIEAKLQDHENQGRTVTLLATDNAVIALFAVADTIKVSSQQAVAELIALGCDARHVDWRQRSHREHGRSTCRYQTPEVICYPRTSSKPFRTCKRQYGPTAMTRRRHQRRTSARPS
jgi:Cd2+/Zn2+-exporting ATPase